MMDVPDWPCDMIAIDLVTDLNVSTSGNQYILTIMDQLTGWLEAFPIPNKRWTLLSIFSSTIIFQVHMCARYILSDNGMELKNQLMDDVLQQLGTSHIFSAPYHPQSSRKLDVFHKYLKPTVKKLCEIDQDNWDQYINQVLASYHVTPHLPTGERPFLLIYRRDPNLPLHQLLEPMQWFLSNPWFWMTKFGNAPSCTSHSQEKHWMRIDSELCRTHSTWLSNWRQSLLLKTKQPGKLDLKWRARYRIVCIGHDITSI